MRSEIKLELVKRANLLLEILANNTDEPTPNPPNLLEEISKASHLINVIEQEYKRNPNEK